LLVGHLSRLPWLSRLCLLRGLLPVLAAVLLLSVLLALLPIPLLAVLRLAILSALVRLLRGAWLLRLLLPSE
jgi:hypothetical protein